MKKRILSLLMTFCVAVCFCTNAGICERDTDRWWVTIDGRKKWDTKEYKIDDTRIILRSRDSVLYELTGTTDKR